jgi:beta-lactamase superfamily II metal-dependent hydrolase
MLTIEMLPAGHGDCLWIEYGDPVRRILVDGGPYYSYKHLRNKIEQLDAHDRHFELLIVTHVDADHIEGILRLLQEPRLGVNFGDVWFNGTTQINAALDQGDLLDERQGEYLQAVLTDSGQRWNGAFGGNVVYVPADGELPKKKLDGDATLTVVSPTAKELRTLAAHWVDIVAKEGFSTGDTAAALERLKKQKRLQPVDTLGDEAPADTLGEADDAPGSDSSVANGSSIAVILEHDDHRLLLAGDAFPHVLVGALERYPGGVPVDLAVFKLPHHGSIRNMTDEMVEAVNCEKFAISSNGKYFGHPSSRAIDTLLNALPVDSEPQLWFNYLSDQTRPWCDPQRQEAKKYTAMHPSQEGDHGIAISFP